ncbi:MAG: hypothetical protein ACXWES_06040 [Solirubrobacterales bacterium]
MAAREQHTGLRFLTAGTCACLAALALALALAGPAQADSGTWERAWGKNVNGGGVFGICTIAPNCMTTQLTPPASNGLGGEMGGPNQVASDSLGNVYVAENNQRIQKFDSSGNWERAWGKDVIQAGQPGDTGTGFEICTVAAACKPGVGGGFLARGGEIGGLGGLRGVATDSLGNNVYVTSIALNRIDKFDSSGNFLLAWGKDVIESGGTGFEICTVAASCKQGEDGVLGGEMLSVQGIETDSLGNVYAGDNHRIQKFNSSGTFLLTWGKNVIRSGQPGDTGTGFEICTAAADCQTGTIGALGGEINSADLGIATDSPGNVYAAEPGFNRIQKFNSSGTWERAWGRDVIQAGGSGDTGTGFEICTVAAACKGAGAGPPGDAPGGVMNSPDGIATDSLGTVYVADASFNRIQEFDSSGNFQRAWGRGVNGGGQWGICTVAANCQSGLALDETGCELQFPSGVATDSLGNVYVADLAYNRISKFVQDPLVPPATPFNCGGSTEPPVEPPVVPVVPVTTPTTPAAAQTLAKKKKHKKKKKKKTHKIEPQFTG